MHSSLLVLLMGLLVALAIAIKAAAQRLQLPALVGYLGLGILLSAIDNAHPFLSGADHEVFDLFAQLGIIALLFRVGLETDFEGLLNNLRHACPIWVGDVTLSAAVGYATARFVLGWEGIPALTVAAALTATSVGIPVAVWRQAKALESDEGHLFLDVAELDDLSGVVFMGLLFAILPVLGKEDASWCGPLLWTLGRFAVTALLFGGFCYLFSRYAEKRITGFAERMASEPDPMLVVVGMGFVIAALAGAVGFSMAIGAFFAGLVFSRDPERVHFDASFSALYDFFTPFFFIGVGLAIDVTLLGAALLPALILLTAAVGGKALGDGSLALLWIPPRGAGLLALSMIPRAEIAMVIMRRGHAMGEHVVPDVAFNSMVLVSAATCLAVPPLLLRGLRKQGA